MPGPNTPPRYRYVKSGDEGPGSEVRKRAGSLGRPVCMSRVLDRQRHGGFCEAPPAPRFVLQAPQLLKLGQLQAPQLEPLRTPFASAMAFFPERRAVSAGRCEAIPTPSRRRDAEQRVRPGPSFDLRLNFDPVQQQMEQMARLQSLRQGWGQTGGQLQAAQSFAASFQRPGFFTERPSRPEEKPCCPWPERPPESAPQALSETEKEVPGPVKEEPVPWPDTEPSRRVLVTGASGLLGRQVMQVLSKCPWEVRGLCRRARPKLVCCDLSDDAALWGLMERFRPQAVLHLAAQWRPERLRGAPAEARRLNVDAAGSVAAACEKFKAWLVHLSADAVFDGTQPPYQADARPNPLSEYGWQKLHSEQLVRAACPRAAVLRVPLLYGPVESPSDSAVTSLLSDLQGGIREVDAWQACYPTWAGDVARVLKSMLELHFAGERLQGIYHWQGEEQFTWHEMMLMVAETAGLDPGNLVAVSSPPSTPLPKDTRMECSQLFNVQRTSLREGLKQCLAPFRKAPEMAGKIVKPEWKALPRARKSENAALQEIFWEELERTRARLHQAGLSRRREKEPREGRHNEQRV